MTGTATLTRLERRCQAARPEDDHARVGTVKCAGAGSKSVTLKPSAAVKRALKKAKGSVKVTLGVSLRATGEAAKQSTRAITLALARASRRT